MTVDSAGTATVTNEVLLGAVTRRLEAAAVGSSKTATVDSDDPTTSAVGSSESVTADSSVMGDLVNGSETEGKEWGSSRVGDAQRLERPDPQP